MRLVLIKNRKFQTESWSGTTFRITDTTELDHAEHFTFFLFSPRLCREHSILSSSQIQAACAGKLNQALRRKCPLWRVRQWLGQW